jgi:hypothetical protein
MADAPIKAKHEITEDDCPLCGSTELSFGNTDIQDNFQWIDASCGSCGFEFRQWFKREFDGLTTTRHDTLETLDIVGPEELPAKKEGAAYNIEKLASAISLLDAGREWLDGNMKDAACQSLFSAAQRLDNAYGELAKYADDKAPVLIVRG